MGYRLWCISKRKGLEINGKRASKSCRAGTQRAFSKSQMNESPSPKKLSPAMGADSETKYRSLFESSRDALMTAEPPSGRFTSGNPAALKMFGAKNQEEFVTHGPRDLSPERQPDGCNSAEKAGEMIETAMREGTHFFEWTHRRISGEEFPADVLLTRMELGGKTIILATVRDITGRKKAEEALRASEERYRSLFETMQEGFALCEIICNDGGKPCDFRYLEVNSAFEEIIGIKRNDVINKTARELFPQIEDYWIETYGKVALTGAAKRFESYFQTLDKHFEVVAFSMERGQFAAIFADITGRKRVEEAALRLAAIVESSNDAIVSTNLEGIITSWNAAAEHLYGYTAHEIIGQSITQIIPEERHQEKEEVLGRVSTGEQVSHFESCCIARAGRRIPVSLTVSPIKDVSGNIVGTSSIIRDITERKRQEEQLRLQSAALEAADNTIVITDTHGIVLWVNPAFTTLTGWSREEVIGKTLGILRSGQHDSNFYRELWETISGGRVWNGEMVNRRKDGSLYTEEMTITPVGDGNGNISRFIAIKQDVTRRKKAEESQRNLQRQQRALLDNIPDIAWVTDRECRYLAVNESLSKAYGHSPEEIVGKTDFDMVPAELAEGYRADDKRVMESRQRKRVEELFEDSTGTRIWIDTIKSPIVNDQGEVIGTAGIARDIAERRRAEAALRGRDRAFDTSISALAMSDLAGNLTYANAAYVKIFGYASAADMLGKPFAPLFADPAAVESSVRTVLEQGHWAGELKARRTDGTLLDVLVSASVATDAAGQPLCIVASLFDITERKQAEEALRASSAYTRSLIEASLDPLVTIGPEGKITDVNAATETVTGRKRTELIGTDFSGYFTDPEKAKSGYQHVFLEGSVRDYPLELRHRDGSVISVLYNATVYRDEAGKVVGVFAAARDVTERKKIENSLRHSEANLAEAQRMARMGSWSFDLATNAVTWSEELHRIFGIEVTDFGSTYESFANRVHPDDRDLVLRTNAAARTHGKSFNIEYRIVLPSGELKTIYEIGYAATDTTGKITRLFGTAQDITERKQAEKALQETNRRLEDALAKIEAAQQQAIQQENLRALGTMASGIAHDFNNSLTAILGGSELLLSRPEYLNDKEKTRSYIEMMNTAAQDAGNVVNRLREFYRHREEREVFIPVNLSDVVVQAVALTQPKWKAEAEARGVSVNVHTDLQQVPLITGNDANLREVLTNLIFNAVDAMPHGGTITIRTYRDDGHVVLKIGDTGTGMTEEVRRRCLEPFFTTKGKAGTGLGLSMIYGIIQRHQGTIDIETEVGKGTTFIIRLPVQTAPPRSEPKAQPVDLVQPLRVLVVDDEAVVRKIVGEYLKLDGHSVEAVDSGRDGLEKFRNSRFDLVLLDRAMPDMSGDEVAAAIKTANPTMPVVMLTGFGSMMDAADEKPAGVDFIVGKPVTINALRAALSKAVASAN